MTRRTYRVTASVGGWRSVPWPFGLLEVDDDGLGIRSWHWSWWLTGKRVARGDVKGIEVDRRFGVATLRIRVGSGKPWKVQVGTAPNGVIEDLRSRGYLGPPLSESQ